MKMFAMLFTALVLIAGSSRATGMPDTVPSPMIQHIFARQELNLDGRWNYIIDPYETGYYDYRRKPFDESASGMGGFYDNRRQEDSSQLVEYDFDGSPAMNVPGDWNSQNDKLLFYEGTIWYRRNFQIHPRAGRRYFIYFAAVNYEAHVYLNGRKLGVHKGGFTPFQFEVTGQLKDGDNFIVVKADNTRHQDEIPTVNTDWWNYGGITRDVVLASVPESFIADYKVQLAKGDLNRIAGYVRLSGEKAVQAVTITIPGVKMNWTVKTDSTGLARFDVPVPGGRLAYWSPEDPRLYSVRLSCSTDEITDSIGFRTIEVRGQDILVNGKPVFLRGVAVHDEDPFIPGRNRSEGDLRTLLVWAKQLGCNYVRLAHYPHNEKMLRLADELGIFVWAEVPVYWTISWTNPATYANADRQLTDEITRDKNRASIIIWSIGNETPLGAPRLSFMSRLADRAHALDDTRLVSAALEVHRKGDDLSIDDPLGQYLDLASFNEYAGWYGDDRLEDLAHLHFTIKYDKPVVISEFGGGALGGFHADSATRWSEEFQAKLYRCQLEMLQHIGALRGMSPWILVDFRSPRRQHPVYQNFWNRKGLISGTGQKKAAFFVLKDFYERMAKKYPGQ